MAASKSVKDQPDRAVRAPGLGAQARRGRRRLGEGVSLRDQLWGAEHLPEGTQLCHLRYLKAQHNSLGVLIFLLLQEQSNQIRVGNGPC